MILIVGALKRELEATVDALKHVQSTTHAAGTHYTGFLDGEPALAAVTGSGKVNAAGVMMQLLASYTPERVYGIGLCGSVRPGIPLKQLVHVSSSVQYDLQIGRFGLKAGEINGSLPRYVHDSFDYPAPEAAASVTSGSADIFLDDAAARQHQEVLDELDIQTVDMESYAWMGAAWLHNTPVRVFRVVSDVMGESTGNFTSVLREASELLYAAVRTQEQIISSTSTQ
ncbi:MAG: hypothetical protein ACQEQU_03880 [Spirochaetota bacterium]